MISIDESVAALSALAADLDIGKLTATCVALLVAAVALYSLLRQTDSIPGPPRPSLRHWLLGHITELLAEEVRYPTHLYHSRELYPQRSPTDALDRWFHKYGHVFRIYGTAGVRMLGTDFPISPFDARC